MATLTCCRGWPYRMRMCVERYATPSAGCPVSGVVCARRSLSTFTGLFWAASMIVESCAKTWPVCHRSFVDWLAGLDDSLDISHIPGSGGRRRRRRGRGHGCWVAELPYGREVQGGAGTDRDETTRLSSAPACRSLSARGTGPPPVDRRYLRPPGECRVRVLEVLERIASKRPRARERRRVRSSRLARVDRRPPATRQTTSGTSGYRPGTGY